MNLKEKYRIFKLKMLFLFLSTVFVLVIPSCSKPYVHPLMARGDGFFLEWVEAIEASNHRYEVRRKNYRKHMYSPYISAYFLDETISSIYDQKMKGLDSCIFQTVDVYDSLLGKKTAIQEYQFATSELACTWFEAMDLRAGFAFNTNVDNEKEKLKQYFFCFNTKVYFFDTYYANCHDCSRDLILNLKKYLGCEDLEYSFNEYF